MKSLNDRMYFRIIDGSVMEKLDADKVRTLDTDAGCVEDRFNGVFLVQQREKFAKVYNHPFTRDQEKSYGSI